MKRMKLSQFTMFIEDYPGVGQHLVYNTLSRAFAKIDNEHLSMLYSLANGRSQTFTGPIIQKFQAQGIVVEQEKDETSAFSKLFSAQMAERKELHATILTTYKCPMRCIYCYQKDIRNNEYMNEYMSDDKMRTVASWLEWKVQKSEINRCFITFYGGKPLMNRTSIEYLGNRMAVYCKDKGVNLQLAMVTSGLLLTPKIADSLKRIGVKYLQITLDGDKDSHDKRRPKRDGSGTFDLIMENLSHLIEGFTITITCNVDKTNAEAASRLIDILYSRGYAGKIRRFTFGPVSASSESAQKYHIACPDPADEEMLSLTIKAARRGFISDLRPGHKICGMLLPSHFVIDPIGRLYTCPAFLGLKEYQVGDISEYDKASVNFVLKEECLKCLYVPICTGGCRFSALVEQNDIQAADCRKEIFSYSIPQLLKTHYDLRSENV